MTAKQFTFVLCLCLMCTAAAFGQTVSGLQDGDALLTILHDWTGLDSAAGARAYCAFATGAALSAGYTEAGGLVIPVRQRLLWPGRLMALADSASTPVLTSTFSGAMDHLISELSVGNRCLIIQPYPYIVTEVDTSFGAPWFILETVNDQVRDTVIWDRADLRAEWWRWNDEPGANTIWQHQTSDNPAIGQRMLQEGMRSLVLSARPDSAAATSFGLAALSALQANPSGTPGKAATLLLMCDLRQSAGEFLSSQLDRWPPDSRDPIKLIAYYFQKDAEAWRTLATVSSDWLAYDIDQRAEWLTTALEWETKVAVALDEFVSSNSE